MNKIYIQGIIYALLAYVSWGILPLYWKLLSHVNPVEILSNRITWASLFVLLLCLFYKRELLLKYIKDLRLIAKLTVTGLLISVNWGIYIYAVNSNHIIDASLGYYINPLVSIVLGMLFLKEKLNKTQIAAFIMAIIGVGWFTVGYGRFPWIAVTLSLSFGLYGLLKKRMNLDSMAALSVETLMVTPIAVTYMGVIAANGENSFLSSGISTDLLLILGGVVTALPLYWFGMAAVRIPLYAVGFFQYISPTTSLIIGIFIYHEHFSSSHFVCFALIWAGLAMYIGNMILNQLRNKRTL